MKDTLVQDIMNREVIAIAPDLGVDAAAELMRSNGIRRLPVVNATNRVIGIITIADALEVLPANLRDDEGFNRTEPPEVREVMADYVYTASPEEPVGVAARKMVNHKIGALPVIEDHKLVGIVTESDIFRFVAEQYERDHPEVGAGA